MSRINYPSDNNDVAISIYLSMYGSAVTRRRINTRFAAGKLGLQNRNNYSDEN